MKHTVGFFVFLFCLAAGSDKKCLKPGMLCESCSSLVACVENSDGTYYKEPLETCDSPSRCVGGACVENTKDPFCTGLADVRIKCKQVGTFPDPFYCNQYVSCLNHSAITSLIPFLKRCDAGFKFNIATSSCDIPLENDQCEDGQYPVPLCEELGQNGALPEKSEMFYICVKTTQGWLHPVLNLCPEGQTFNNYRCTDTDLVLD